MFTTLAQFDKNYSFIGNNTQYKYYSKWY